MLRKLRYTLFCNHIPYTLWLCDQQSLIYAPEENIAVCDSLPMVQNQLEVTSGKLQPRASCFSFAVLEIHTSITCVQEVPQQQLSCWKRSQEALSSVRYLAAFVLATQRCAEMFCEGLSLSQCGWLDNCINTAEIQVNESKISFQVEIVAKMFML